MKSPPVQTTDQREPVFRSGQVWKSTTKPSISFHVTCGPKEWGSDKVLYEKHVDLMVSSGSTHAAGFFKLVKVHSAICEDQRGAMP